MTKNKKLLWQVPFLTLLIIGTILIIRHQSNMPYQHCTGLIFGTTYNITYQFDEDLKDELVGRMLQVDSALSMFNKESVISHINRGDAVIPQNEIGRMFLDVYQLAAKISEKTGGAFDITVAPLVNAWGFGFKQGTLPSRQQVDSLRSLVGYHQVSLHNKNGQSTIRKARPGIMLDCSAIAKGYGADMVARLLEEKGVKNYLVEIGGEIVTQGVSEKRLPWKIGVTKPSEDTLYVGNELQTVLNITDKAMATSGNYRNFYYKGGRKYAHTIDPKTGYPVRHALLSATVLTDQCAVADAYATAFMVMGIEGAKRVLQQEKQLMAYLIFTDRQGRLTVWYSPSLKDKIVEEP